MVTGKSEITVSMLYIGVLVFLSRGYLKSARAWVQNLSGVN